MGPRTGLFDVGGQRLVTPPIRGRAGELKVIGALVAAVAQGRGGVLVIEGPPGIGKSRLLTEVLALAEKAGVRALFGEAFEYQQTVPFFSLFMATLRADPPSVSGGVAPAGRLGGSALLGGARLADAIHAAAAQTPLAIVLEDIHWADNGTLLALRSLATVRPDVAVLWVLTARTGAGGPAVQETLSMLHRADATFLRLAAMTPDAVAHGPRRRAGESRCVAIESGRQGARQSVSGQRAGRGARRGGPAQSLRRPCDGHRRRAAAAYGRQHAAATRPAFRRGVEVVRVAAVLPDRFSAGLLAAMLERSPVALCRRWRRRCARICLWKMVSA